MMGTGLQFPEIHGDDRCFDGTKPSRNHRGRHRNALRYSGGADDLLAKLAGLDEPAKDTAASSSSNLDRFLESTTPSVPAQYFSKMRMREWRSCDIVECGPYFLLADLWESFKEWSAYGAGVPLVLNESDCVIQYYVPYLSGIELYGYPLARPDSSRMQVEDSDGDCYRDSSSDGSSDCELDRGLEYAREWDRNDLSITSTLGIDRLFLREDNIQEGFSSDDSDSGNSQGCLLVQYLERDPPHTRVPLADKISDLVRSFPVLKSSRSCDLLPASWISVSWYPIYRIPTGPTLKDLDACFLTFHSLSTSMAGAAAACLNFSCPNGIDLVPKISLRPFGLASYKFKGPLWTPTGGCEKQLASSLSQAADDWLRLLNVNHPDYCFFTSHGAFR